MNACAVSVGQDLKLDVTRSLDQLLQIDAVIAKRIVRLAPCGSKRSRQFVGLMDDAHPLAAATGRGLDEQGIADGRGRSRQFIVTLACLITRDDRHAGCLHGCTRRGLAAHDPHRRGGRADEGETCRAHCVGEVSIF